MPLVITEGPQKTIALYRLSWDGDPGDRPRFVAVGLNGVWGFSGTIGKSTAADGSRQDEKGLIADVRRLPLGGRRGYIVYDTNVRTNPKVAATRIRLSQELTNLGAIVLWVDLPATPDVNGVDDPLALRGPEYVLHLIEKATPAPLSGERPNQAEILTELASKAEFFCDSAWRVAEIGAGGWRVRSLPFFAPSERSWRRAA